MTAAADVVAPPLPAKPVPLYKSLFAQVLVALVAGIVIGMAWPDLAIGLKVFSDGFLKLISMIVAPIVFCVVVHGIAGAGDLRKVGRVGVKALVYFEVMTTLALALGIVLAYAFGPGHGMNIDTATLDARALSSYADNAHKLQGGGIGRVVLAEAERLAREEWGVGLLEMKVVEQRGDVVELLYAEEPEPGRVIVAGC